MLTGLYNRRGILNLLQLEISRTNRYQHSFALVLIDLNQFKEINDRYGHRQGDNALKHFSLLLQKNVRKTDMVRRIGGDEFILLLLSIEQEQAVILVEKIQEEVLQHKKKHPKLVSSFSAGILECGVTKLEALELLSRVDKLMYLSKKNKNTKIMSDML